MIPIGTNSPLEEVFLPTYLYHTTLLNTKEAEAPSDTKSRRDHVLKNQLHMYILPA